MIKPVHFDTLLHSRLLQVAGCKLQVGLAARSLTCNLQPATPILASA
jgi:hypothetical protein